MNNVSPEKQEEVNALVSSLEGKYRVRTFKTTTESIAFLKKVMPLVGSMSKDLESLNNEDISRLFDIFPEEVIFFIVSTFVEVKKGETFKKVDYDKEFKGDFQTLLAVFMMALMKLLEEVSKPTGKPQGKNQKKIRTKRR